MKKICSLVLSGLGINCEKETGLACQLAGAEVDIKHVQHLIKGKIKLKNYQLICFPGGFSFGDELGAAKVFSNRMLSIKKELLAFVESGGCILGICNGFQLLVKLGLLPFGKKQCLTLAHNNSSRFENRWVYHRVCPSNSIFTKGLDKLYLPVRHGEGRLIVQDPQTLETLKKEGYIVFQYCDEDGEITHQYPKNPNGSIGSIGGLSDKTGRILGMMAHPEAALYFVNHPNWTREKNPQAVGDGRKIFTNVIEYLR